MQSFVADVLAFCDIAAGSDRLAPGRARPRREPGLPDGGADPARGSSGSTGRWAPTCSLPILRRLTIAEASAYRPCRRRALRRRRARRAERGPRAGPCADRRHPVPAGAVVDVKDDDSLAHAVLDAGINVAEPVRGEFHQLFSVSRPGARRRLPTASLGPSARRPTCSTTTGGYRARSLATCSR